MSIIKKTQRNGKPSTIRQTALAPRLKNIPQELRKLDQWVCWKYIERPGDKPGKMPIAPKTGGQAKCNDPVTWTSFDVAVQACESNEWEGVWFALTADDPYVGIDLDDCRGTNNVLTKQAKEIVKLLDTYV